jgi:hypothetical protein
LAKNIKFFSIWKNNSIYIKNEKYFTISLHSSALSWNRDCNTRWHRHDGAQ